MKIIVGPEEIAKELNLGLSQVHALVKQGLPKESRGKFHIIKCFRWYTRYQQVERSKRGSLDIADTGSSLRSERERLTRAQADREELDLARDRGELVHISLYEAELSREYVNLRQRLLTLDRIAPQLEGETRLVIKHKINQAVRELLTALSIGDDDGNAGNTAYGGYGAGGFGSASVSATAEPGGVSTPAVDDNQPMGGAQPGNSEG